MIGERERFLFDVQGFLLVRGALSPAEVRRLRGLVHALEEREYDDSGWARPWNGQKPSPTREHEGESRLRLNGLLRLDDAFHSLIDHPAVLPYLEAFMDRPQVVNTWSITKGPGASPGCWHRGLGPEGYSARNGAIRCRMLNTVWFLDDNGPEDGCMVAVPGSHKNAIDLEWHTQGQEMPGATPVTGRAGDLFLFSESVLHDGLRKTTAGKRTNLYFNYGANDFSVMTYSPQHNRHFCMPPSVRARFSERQRAMSAWMEHAQPVEDDAPVRAG